jgi:FlaA1/EpsC-like NDP-sugar epimerase
MTIPEASQLILQAGGLGKGGEVFILKMGTPVRIADMARDLIRLSGKEPDRDIKIEYTGLRPGEKLYEELITHGEGIVPTEHEKIMVLKTNGKWNGNGNQKSFQKWLNKHLDELYHLADLHRAKDIREKLHCLVPEYLVQHNSCILDVPRRDSSIKEISKQYAEMSKQSEVRSKQKSVSSIEYGVSSMHYAVGSRQS